MHCIHVPWACVVFRALDDRGVVKRKCSGATPQKLNSCNHLQSNRYFQGTGAEIQLCRRLAALGGRGEAVTSGIPSWPINCPRPRNPLTSTACSATLGYIYELFR